MTPETQTILSIIPPLTPEQRDLALLSARQTIAGKPPAMEPLPDETHDAPDPDALPKRLVITSIALTLALACIAFVISAIRVHQVALESLGQVVTHATSLHLSALLTVLLSEVGAVALLLAAIRVPERTIGLGRVRFNPYTVAYQLGAVACAGIAVSGNAKAMGAIADPDLYVLLETYTPPIITLITAYALKTQLVEAVKSKHRAAALRVTEVQRVRAVNAEREAAYQERLLNAPQSDRWPHACAKAFMDTLISANRSVGNRATALRAAGRDERSALVVREMQADAVDWFELPPAPPVRVEVERTPEQPNVTTTERVRLATGKTAGRSTGELENAVVRDGDAWVATCPTCQTTYRKTTQRAAMNALVAHLRTHKPS